MSKSSLTTLRWTRLKKVKTSPVIAKGYVKHLVAFEFLILVAGVRFLVFFSLQCKTEDTNCVNKKSKKTRSSKKAKR